MQIAQTIDQNFMFTSSAPDLGRGKRSEPTYGLNQETPGPGTHEKVDEYEPFRNELRRKGIR